MPQPACAGQAPLTPEGAPRTMPPVTQLRRMGFMGRGEKPGQFGVTREISKKAEDRRRRLAEALRENLKKRRRQARARSRAAAEATGGEGCT